MNVFIAEKSRIYELVLLGTYADVLIYEKKVVFILVNRSWHMKLPYDLVYVSRDPIEDGGKVTLKLKQKEEICELFFLSDSSSKYHKYEIKDIVRIGPYESDDIAFEDKIQIDTVHHQIVSESSFTSLNGKRFQKTFYQCGDILLAKGLHVIFGPAFLMIQQKNEKTALRLFEDKSHTEPIPFHCTGQRSIMHVPQFPAFIELKAPKKILSVRQNSSLSMMLPSIMMMSAVMLIGIWNAYRAYEKGKDILDSLPSVLMPAVMLLSVLCAYPLMNLRQKRKYLKEVKERDQIYRMYLQQTVRDTMNLQREYYFALYQNHVSISFLLASLHRHVFPEPQEDLRIGTCIRNLHTEIKKHFNAEEEDTLIDEIQQAEGKLDRSVHVPFLMPKMKIQIEGEDAEKLFLSLLIQAAVYGRKVYLISDHSFMNKYPFLLRLPGLMHQGGRNIFGHFQPSDDALIFQTAAQEINENTIYLDHVSQNAQLVLHAGRENWYYDAIHHQKNQFQPELYAGIFPDVPLTCPLFFQYNDPSFLDLYHVNDAKDLCIPSRWAENNNENNLNALIGCEISGADIVLDLSEQGNGPHGLIAGTTGSGKSELILTMLLSLMVNYSPQDVQIAFIDFKGGSALNAFEVEGKLLPHIVGTMSNLDLHNTERVLYALKNECILRQKRFREAGLQYHVSIMNLYDYRILQGKQKELPPMADLFLIVDEFAELKAQSYEMLNQLISISRIGRSLGIHLILSTQKPAGVVNDQIWSNSRFKICLKVSEKQDSIEILHSPDAIELKQPGQFILECDGTRRKGICGYSGYRKSRQKLTLHILDSDGRKIDDYASYGEFAEPQILEVCREIDNAGKECRVQKLWLDPIKKCHWQQLLKEKAFGIIDDYYTQKQPYCVFHYDAHSHLAILTSDLYVRNGVIRYFKFLLEKEFHEINVYETEEILNQSSFNPAVFCSNQKKVVIVNDTGRFYEQAAKYRIHELLEHSQEYNIQFIFFLSQSSAMPYHDQNLIGQKICMKNDNAEEISTFLGVRVKRTLKEKDGGLIVWNHLLEIRMGYVE
jgi:hypothetical protein